LKLKFQFSIHDLLIFTGLIAVGICGAVYLREWDSISFSAFLIVLFGTFGATGAGLFQLLHKPMMGMVIGLTFASVIAILSVIFEFLVFGLRHA
jgi:hypothetical protein